MCVVASGWSQQGVGLSRRRFIGAGLAGAVSATVLGNRKLAAAQTLPGPTVSSLPGVVALTGATIYLAPDVPPIQRGTVVARDRRIVAVGKQGEVAVPAEARILDCSGLSVAAGFSNCHVHFTGAKWQDTELAPATLLTDALAGMLTRYGFVRVVDTGSWLPNTRALGRRLDRGDVAGPQIMTAGPGFAPAAGSPYYIQPLRLPELTDPGMARTLVTELLDADGDVVKLYTGSWATQTSIVVMPVDVVRAATSTAHQRGKLVVAHPSNGAGARAAVDGGVDILAHTFPSELTGLWDRSLPLRIREAGMAMIPTLKLWQYEVRRLGLPAARAEAARANSAAQLKAFVDAGGQLLFGTDVGYMADYDPTDEYVLMQQAGLTFSQILASLTTGPAARFARAAHSGRIAAGMDADLVALDRNPERDITALARVRYAVRLGRVIYEGRPVTG
jgi:imidazolonepropionase-like amidohydrolase